jgi:hypothetical protein
MTTPRTDLWRSPLHQGSRSRTGEQVDRQFRHDLLAVLGDCRLLWVPSLTDTTTSPEASRYGATITWSKNLAAFDTPPARLGAGVAVDFNGTDEEGDTPDADQLSFGDGASDQPFSVVALIAPDVNNVLMDIINKDDGASREWLLFLGSGGDPEFRLYDHSSTGHIARKDGTPFGTSRGLLVGTYDGSGAAAGIQLWKNAVPVADSDTSSGSYTSMENGSTLVHLGARNATASQFFNGTMSLVAVTAKELVVSEIWTIKELVNAYFGLSL